MRYFLIVLLLSGVVWSRESHIKRVTFHTDPTGASIYLDVTESRERAEYLGKSGEEIKFDTNQLHGASGANLVFVVDGYHVKKERLPALYFEAHNRYPEKGRIVLEPVNNLVRVRVFLTNYGYYLGLGALVLGAAGVYAVRRRRLLEELLVQAKEREAALEAYDQKSASNILTVVGSYRLVEQLGEGGNAYVYRAIPKTSLDESESVAVKIMKSTSSRDVSFMQRFLREIELCTSLNHPCVVKTLDWGEESGVLYLAQQLLPGGNLRDLIEPGGIPIAKAVDLLTQILEGLNHAHESGVIHRDIKPENLMLTAAGTLKIADFGLARTATSNLTKTGSVLGTPAYISPEEVSSDKSMGLNYWADQYAVGIVAFELLTGRKPFIGEDVMAVMFRQFTEEPPSPQEIREDVPDRLAAFVLKLIAKKYTDRFKTTGDALDELKKISKDLEAKDARAHGSPDRII